MKGVTGGFDPFSNEIASGCRCRIVEIDTHGIGPTSGLGYGSCLSNRMHEIERSSSRSVILCMSSPGWSMEMS
jgi:hypothetical protein